VFSLQILREIEKLFRGERQRHDLVLADEYDLFAGTSTGAIIAACLSWGMPVDDIEEIYLTLGHKIFAKQYLFWKTKYRAKPITQLLMERFTETPGGREPALLGSARLRKLLVVVMRNASTGSPWPVSNNPHAAFNDPSLPDCNLKIPLWQLLRASTAAPYYFPPEKMQLGGQSFLFMDGGMTAFNNPTLIAVFMATLPPYRLSWPASREQLHVVSIGTGDTRTKLRQHAATDVKVWDAVPYMPPALIGASAVEQDLVCRVLGDCVHGAALDSEIGALDSPSLLAAHEQKFTYVRYDQAFDTYQPEGQKLLQAEAELDDLKQIPVLQQMGRDYASRHVRRDHLYPRSIGVIPRL